MSQIAHPDYYKGNSIEAWDYIKDHDLNFDLGNAVKYITRAGKKDSESKRDDLEKAVNYICHELGREGLVYVYGAVNVDDDTDPDEVTIWSANMFGNHTEGELDNSDIDLCKSKSTGTYTLYVERSYQFKGREEEACYLQNLKEQLAGYVLNKCDATDYKVTYADDIDLGCIYGDTIGEVYEKFAFLVDAYIGYVYDD